MNRMTKEVWRRVEERPPTAEEAREGERLLWRRRRWGPVPRTTVSQLKGTELCAQLLPTPR